MVVPVGPSASCSWVGPFDGKRSNTLGLAGISQNGFWCMCRIPRIALGTIQKKVDLQPLLAALLKALERADRIAQLFSSQSCFRSAESFSRWGGMRQRYLDSWLMSPAMCRQSFCLGARGCDLSIVFGQFATELESELPGGSLERLCEWLELPRIVVLDVGESRHCYFPKIPEMTCGVILLGVRSIEDRVYWQTYLESHFGVRLMGTLAATAAELSAWQQEIERDGRNRWVEPFADQMTAGLNWNLFSEIATKVEPLDPADDEWTFLERSSNVNVAIAYDDAFNCYFPDTLDLLEMQGARLHDFSPLRGEGLPDLCDLVLVGCGQPERFAEKLSGNHCMKQALREHVNRGGRLYAEGGGLAYACQSLECEAGQFPMAGLLPAKARWQTGESHPVEIRLDRANWLADIQSSILGYRSTSWSIEPQTGLQYYCDDPQFRFDIVGYRGVLGSRMLLHFASQPRMMQNLLRPVREVEC